MENRCWKSWSRSNQFMTSVFRPAIIIIVVAGLASCIPASLPPHDYYGYLAWGFGGQYIFIVPDLDLVVVFNGTNWSTDPKKFYFEIMEDYIIRACDI